MTGLLDGLLPQLDIPVSAKLVAIETRFADDGTQTWTVTFSSAASTLPSSVSTPLAAVQPPTVTAATPSQDTAAVAVPRPPPLSDVQLAGGASAAVLQRQSGPPAAHDGMSPSRESDPPLSPPSASFPLLPFQIGAVNRLFPLRACTQSMN